MVRKTLKRFLQNDRGFSLTELLVVIVIIGILAALALPKFITVITRAKATEAKLMLKQVYQLQQTYYMEHDVYADHLAAIGFEAEQLKTEGGTARYQIEMTDVSPTGFTATATAVIDFDKDGTLNIWQVDETGQIVETQPD
jgi:type IV pilus assembly protein PilE